MSKVIAFWIAFGALASIAAPALAGTVKLSGRHSSGEIRTACDKNGGTFTTLKGGGYECMGKGENGGYIHCGWNGECTGSCGNCGKSAASGTTGKNSVGGILTGAPKGKAQPLTQQATTSPGGAPTQPLTQQKVKGSPAGASRQPLTQQTVGSSNNSSKESNASSSSRRNNR